MSLRLFSHVNADSDLIEAWLKYYLRLGVDWFHLVVHGPPEENAKLLAIKGSYPITIEDVYQGPFPATVSHGGKLNSTEKKNRLDALLARYTGQWVLLVDSDEFVEFPYRDIPETIRKLECANADLMAAPMLQRLKTDGSLDSPPVIDDPFEIFPLCSVDLYRRMAVSADIFKFPLFYCASGTELVDDGNHHPPRGLKPKAAEMRGVTHHFKFRRTITQRLEKRINSEHPWRYESVGFRQYLENHANRLPLEEAFPYSREELFRRKLLRELPSSADPGCQKANAHSADRGCENQQAYSLDDAQDAIRKNEQSRALSLADDKKFNKIMFVLPKTTEFGGLERHLLDFLRRLNEPHLHPLVVCFAQDIISSHMDGDLRARVVVKCEKEPESLWDWLRLIRGAHPDIVVFCFSWIEAFPWQAPFAALLAGVRKRFSIQHLIPPPLPPPVRGSSPRKMLRRFIGKRARRLLGLKVAGHASRKTVCVSNAVRDALVTQYGFPARRTITVHNGVSTSTFAPSEMGGETVRARLDINSEEFLLVCATRLVEAKGVDILLQAVSRVVRQGISCRCIIVGDGPLKEKLLEEVNRLGLWGCVYFEGFQEDVRPYLQAASAFILTSHLEGLPLSVLEAMACGVPCIVTNVGGSAEAVKDQVVGLVIPPASVDAAADAISYLAVHPRERAVMAGRTRETVCRSFDIEDSMGELRRVVLS
jgi:glycosyltransferase involved in cell wall biosynthesis